jgi:hypothetical protein
MKNKILLFITLFCVYTSVYSRVYLDDSLRFKHNINFSFAKPDFGISSFSNDTNFLHSKFGLSILKFEYNFRMLDYLSAGFYGRVGKYNETIAEIDSFSLTNIQVGKQIFASPKYCWHYGINAKLHLIPLIFKKNIPRFDIYWTGNFGLISDFKSPENHIFAKTEHFIDASSTLGLSLYLTKYIGIYTEYGYSRNKYFNGFNTQLGICFRF